MLRIRSVIRHLLTLSLLKFEDAGATEIASGGDKAVKVATKDPLHKPKKARIASLRALAQAIKPIATAQKYRVASSKPGQFYELEIEGTDVLCTCRGFEFRGQCKHARTLKDALVNEGKAPDGYDQI